MKIQEFRFKQHFFTGHKTESVSVWVNGEMCGLIRWVSEYYGFCYETWSLSIIAPNLLQEINKLMHDLNNGLPNKHIIKNDF